MKLYVKTPWVENNVTKYKSNDCVIVALGNILDISYDFTKSIVQNIHVDNGLNVRLCSYKKPKNEFTRTYNVKNLILALGGQRITLDRKMSVLRFTQTHTEGRYFVLISGHVFVVNHGDVIDYSRKHLSEPIEEVYELNWSKAIRSLNEISKMLSVNLDKHMKMGELDNFIRRNKNKSESEVMLENKIMTKDAFIVAAKKKGINANLYNHQFTFRGKQYKIVSVVTSGRTYLLAALCFNDNKVYNIHNSIFASLNIKVRG